MTAPQNLEAEEAILGAVLLSPKAIEAAADVVRPEDFYRDSHRIIFRATLDMLAEGKPVDPVTLVAELEERGQLEEAGGKVRVYELAAMVTATSNVGHYATIVRDVASKRLLLRQLLQVEKAMDGPLEEALQTMEDALAFVRNSERDGKREVVPLHRALGEFEEELRQPPLSGERAVSTPFSFLSPMRPGRVYILGGYMKDGKTGLAGQFATGAAESGKRVGFASIEMPYADLRDRFISLYGIPAGMVQARMIAPPYQERLRDAISALALMDISIIDDEDLDVARLRRHQKLHGFDLLIIDHLHRFDWKERRDLERVMRGIVNIAREFDVPVLLLAQLKRPFGTDRAPRPTMSMLRESGMIEAEASAVWFVYRQRDEKNMRTNNAEFIVAADRYGSEGIHELWFNPDSVRFDEAIAWNVA